MMRAAALAAALLWPGVALAQTGWAPECKLHRVASLPMTAAGTVITVPVSVNGIEKNFLVDTGGYVSSVNQRVADELKLTPHEIMFNRIRDVSGKDATQYVWADTFKLGAMEARKFDLMVSATKNPRIDGVLSPDLLRNFDVEFDFAAMTLNLFRPHACDGQAVYWTKDFVSIPMELTKTGHTRISVTVDGDPNHVRFSHVFPTLTFDGVTVTNARFEIYPDLIGAHDPNNISRTDTRVRRIDDNLTAGNHISIGMDVLRRLRLFVAFSENKLYITPATAQVAPLAASAPSSPSAAAQ